MTSRPDRVASASRRCRRWRKARTAVRRRWLAFLVYLDESSWQKDDSEIPPW